MAVVGVRGADRATITTAAGVALDLRLAGPAARGMAAAVDGAVQAGCILALAALGVSGSALLVAAVAVLVASSAACELLLDGRTPGKAWVGLRVVDHAGGPLSARSVLVRNALRVVDLLPLPYGVGIASMLLSPANQRVGDRAAGTLVVRPVPLDRASLMAAVSLSPPAAPWDWDVSALSPAHLALARAFLARRWALPPAVRAAHAHQVAAHLRALVPDVPPDLHAEAALEGIVLRAGQASGRRVAPWR